MIGERHVLLVVDIQNDFCPGGSRAVPGGHEVVPIINDIARRFQHLVLTQDWPRGATPPLRPRIRVGGLSR